MVHLDTPVCEWHAAQFELNSNLNVAIFHMPFPFNLAFNNKIEWAIDNFDYIIVLCSELHDDSVAYIQNSTNYKLRYFTCGMIDGYDTDRWMDWFITTSVIYKNNDLLNRLTPYAVKPMYFDALLGWSKPHRQRAYDFLKNHTDKVILRYLQDRSLSLVDSGWLSDDYETPQHIKNTVTTINYREQQVSLSQIIPYSVYNQTAYSIVAETNYSNHYSFYTEKIVKPILAERLFLVFAGQHYLKNLRQMGFKTFDGIIDERYDSEPDLSTRCAMVNDQISYLLSQPQEHILEQIKPITEHNKNLMLLHDWQAETHSDIKKFINDYNKQ